MRTLRTDPAFIPPSAPAFPGRDVSNPKPEQDQPKRGRFKWDTARIPEADPSEYDDDAWM